VDGIPEVSQDTARNSGDAAVYILSQKKSNWAYEREWRVLANREKVSGRRQPVTAIYFGLRIATEHRHRILTRLNGTGIRAYAMQVNGYDHVFAPANDPARGKKKSRAKASNKAGE
jgi:hypothetical protein